jgi:hypothetical protein
MPRFTYQITLLVSAETPRTVSVLEQRQTLFNPALADAKVALEGAGESAGAVLIAQFRGADATGTPSWQGVYAIRRNRFSLVARPGRPERVAGRKIARALTEARAKTVLRKAAAKERSLAPFNVFLIDRPCADAEQANAVVENVIAAGGVVEHAYNTWSDPRGAKTIAVRVRSLVTKSAFELMLRSLSRIRWVNANVEAQAA